MSHEQTLGIIILVITIVLIVCVLLLLAHLDRKLYRWQKLGVDRAMRPTYENGLLHSEEDFKEAASAKSSALLFRQLLIPIPLLVLLLVILISVSAATCDSIGKWWAAACFGLEGTYAEVGGMNLLYGLESSPLIGDGEGYLSVLIPILNILTVSDLILIVLIEQGILARRKRISEILSQGWRQSFSTGAKTEDTEPQKSE